MCLIKYAINLILTIRVLHMNIPPLATRNRIHLIFFLKTSNWFNLVANFDEVHLCGLSFKENFVIFVVVYLGLLSKMENVTFFTIYAKEILH